MIEEFGKFLRLKFDERNQNMIKTFTLEKQKFNARGLLNSSGTVVALHEVAKNELIECKNLIISTAFDVINHLKLIPKTDQIEKICILALKNRQGEIEGIFLANVNHIVSGLQNTKMIEPYLSLNDSIDLQLEELKIGISTSYQLHLKEHGGNLLGLLKNRFLNRYVVACTVIVIGAIITVASFWDGISKLLKINE
jgi:hypothetical protein